MAKHRWLVLLVLFPCVVALSSCEWNHTTDTAGISLPGDTQPVEPPPVEPLPSKTLQWEPPELYTDGSPLDPVAELDRFEIYVKEEDTFREEDTPIAVISAVEPGADEICRTFDLSNLAPFINNGVVYHFALRAESKMELKSDFSPSATFSF